MGTRRRGVDLNVTSLARKISIIFRAFVHFQKHFKIDVKASRKFIDFLEEVNPQLETLGLDANGYGWLKLIKHHLSKNAASLVERIHTGDIEGNARIIWVESAKGGCRKLIKIVWKLLHNEGRISSTKFVD